ncbi:hypothetical protein LTR10_020117 [Elasticomyces elasticus]|uniref:Ion transport domain-containing protein n=1 Tax=Exophiala sideris TaxID=1016849 RepID=A0ABR0IWB0_9EURO|nr:hypothetical protein LTR10_020117 [Elasticomyces elasticus]KAK5021578.1 hypothetical protein LTS07_010875 [Exophiala sideris]KAK5024790.1 hypothetical protein LTR13_010759 [Exophiala sideris]KAK5049715.1 hypothetical protein LTR69_010899 [Exophiala sideris]KAK5176696.1 hypothetical protein LTR44_010766 [Eurotiomycetes sp. CCFEE 6388]
MPSRNRPSASRGFSRQYRMNLQRTEMEALLASQHDEEDMADSDGLYPPHCTWTSAQDEPPPGADPYKNADCKVYENIYRIRRDIISSIDDPYSLEQLKAPRMNISVVRPLVDALYEMEDLSVVYCLLVNRMQFIREQSFASHHQTVNLTRALLCELVAEKILRRYNEQNPGPRGLLKLANILVAGFEPFQGAPEEVCKQSVHAMHWAAQRKGGRIERKLTALEIAIISASKSFLASSACQKVVDAIYRGKLVYTPNSFIDIIPDHWKKRPISLYDPRRAPLLNQYRLIVPRTRNLLELCNFVVLLALYIAVMAGRESRMRTDYTLVEGVFDVYCAGWVLDQAATILEHGWVVYTQNLWSFLDVTFSLIFLVYLIMRLQAFQFSDEEQSIWWARTALDILSCGAPVLIPRLAFNIASENMLFLSLRAMMSDFLTLTALAVWCFAGFLLSLKWLHAGAHQSVTIGKWMIWIWFGLDGTGINRATDFHWLLGPVLMVLFAFLGNTLFLTILVSMLTNTFSSIAGNAIQEIQFRRAVLTFEGVKSDAIFAYMPPFNILALLVMLPLKTLLSERMFHKINVAAVRTLNLPTLLLIAWYERRTLWIKDKKGKQKRIDWKYPGGPRATKAQYWEISRFTVHGDIHAVFDIDPPQSVLDSIAEEDDLGHVDRVGRAMRNSLNEGVQEPSASRRNSQAVENDKGTTASPRTRSKKDSDSKPDKSKSEFEDSDGANEEDHPPGYKKMKRTERMDSLVDLNDDDDTNNKLLEANARLHKMEEAMMRMEALLTQLVKADDASSENSEGKQELAEEMRTNSL